MPWFLAVGDSITFGFTLDPARATRNEAWPVQLQHLLAASGRPWTVFDTACPGETTVSYATRCPQRGLVPFLAGTSQRQVAVDAVRNHGADLRLILVALGSNDLLRAVSTSDPGLVIAGVRDRLTAIVAELQAAAPGVPVVVATIYDPFENSDPATLPQVQQVNAAIAEGAQSLHVAVADFFGAINTPSAPDHALCTYIDCAHVDIHPTVAGQARLAAAAYVAIPGRPAGSSPSP